VPPSYFKGEPVSLTLPTRTDLLNLFCRTGNFGKFFVYTGNLQFNRNDKELINICLTIRVILLVYLDIICGPDCSVDIATDYGLDDPGSNPGGDEIFQTGPGAHPASCKMGTRSFPRVK